MFYPRYCAETATKFARWVGRYLRLRRIYLSIKHDPDRFKYTDTAMMPVADDETETHELFRSDAAQAYLGQQQRLEKLRHGEMV